MNFGVYLVRTGRLTSDEFLTLLETQIASRPKLGTLAIETGRLSVRQVFQILRRQCEQPGLKFGEAAVEMGFLNEDQLAALVYRQSIRAMPFGEIIALHGYSDPEQVEQWMDEYRAAQGRATFASADLMPAEVATAAVC